MPPLERGHTKEGNKRMTTVPDTVRMSHRNDPSTSHDAAAKVLPKVAMLQGAILTILEDGPKTPAEVTDAYDTMRGDTGWLPYADIYDIRRRWSELYQDGRIEPIQVGTHDDWSPVFLRRNNQRVMRLVVES
jgi:hypothetical protein